MFYCQIIWLFPNVFSHYLNNKGYNHIVGRMNEESKQFIALLIAISTFIILAKILAVELGLF